MNSREPPIAGPSTIRLLAGLTTGAGTWTDIVSIIYPLSATLGELVHVNVTVKNISASSIYITAGARYDNSELRFSPEFVLVAPGARYTFLSSFSMPNENVQVSIWSFYWDGAQWFEDDFEVVAIALADVPGEDGILILNVSTYVVA